MKNEYGKSVKNERQDRPYWAAKSILTYVILLVVIWLAVPLIGAAIFASPTLREGSAGDAAFLVLLNLIPIGLPSILCILLLWYVKRRARRVQFFPVATTAMVLVAVAAHAIAWRGVEAFFLITQLSVQLLGSVAMTIYPSDRKN